MQLINFFKKMILLLACSTLIMPIAAFSLSQAANPHANDQILGKKAVNTGFENKAKEKLPPTTKLKQQ